MHHCGSPIDFVAFSSSRASLVPMVCCCAENPVSPRFLRTDDGHPLQPRSRPLGKELRDLETLLISFPIRPYDFVAVDIHKQLSFAVE